MLATIPHSPRPPAGKGTFFRYFPVREPPSPGARRVTAKAWEKVLAQLRGEVSEQVFETWLRPLRFVAREGPILFVATPHKFFKEWI